MAKINRATRIALVTGEMRDCISAAGARAQLTSQQSAEAHGCSTARSLLTIRTDLRLLELDSPAMTPPADYSHAFRRSWWRRIMSGPLEKAGGCGPCSDWRADAAALALVWNRLIRLFQLHQMELSIEAPCEGGDHRG